MKSTKKKSGDDDSDVEMEGMIMDGDEDEEGEESQQEDTTVPNIDDDDDDSNTKYAEEEARDQAAAREERMELVALKAAEGENEGSTPAEARMMYLLKQSEVFAHFLAGSVAAEAKKGKGKKGGKRGRLSEAAEDAAMMKSAQSKRKVVRLDKQPGNLAAICKMHAYQLEGLNWLIKLHDHGINGILADEMGLGKTLQTISLLAYLRESRGVRGPHLVIVPKSVAGNWIKEIKKWCPSIKAIRMMGNKDDRKRVTTEELPPDPKTGKRKWDVLVTSYEGILKEQKVLQRINWKYLIIDEAHRIKNENSSLSRAVRLINTDFRVLITGTPLQNNLHELWALLNFLLPDIFGDADQFDEWFSLEGAEGKDNVIKKLHTVLRPFMLRRVKKDVAVNLPPKKETKLFIGLTQVQQEWYKKILRKDAHELNALGGPDKVRLLNILMQLRKVCNHPYLFEGAEPGPPFFDGPHIWEASGKMMLMHKLLPKLKAKGSRILIFSQMTRVLDILEDYMRYVGHDYCRIDGNTDGELRDSQMEVFNAPKSPKFVFLLSTRAGGLGINLATADIVILYDSDWNPQVDLQAMDRAHRIGQTKPVQVFRFVTEGSVEEKIIERADRKLFLDAAVIQQGRLAEQHKTVDKKDLMHLVRFGADQILSAAKGTYTDEDVDLLIAKGEEKTDALNAKLQTNAQHNLASFSLMGEEETDMLTFGGKSYRDDGNKNEGNFINLPQRERKRNYDVNDYYKEAMGTGSTSGATGDAPAKKKKKGPILHDFQLFDKPRLMALNEKEYDLAIRSETQMELIKELRQNAKHAPSKDNSRVAIPFEECCEGMESRAAEMEANLWQFDMSKEDIEEKERLMNAGFPDWVKKDFKSFCSGLERLGRYNVPSIVEEVSRECGKDEAEVKRYYVAFWTHYRRISDWKKIMDRVERGEKKINRLRQIRDAIQEKVDRHLNEMLLLGPDGANSTSSLLDSQQKALIGQAWQTMSFNYSLGYAKGRAYTEEEDAFLLFMMHKHGYGAAERIRMEIRRAWQFRFDWYFKSRTAQEIQKRCELLIKLVEKENELVVKKERGEQLQAHNKEDGNIGKVRQDNGQSTSTHIGSNGISAGV